MKNLILVVGMALASTAFAADPVSDAFTNCVNANVTLSQANSGETVGRVTLQKIGVDGSDKTVLQFVCRDSNAQALFEAIDRFKTSEGDRVWSKGDRVITRNFGSLETPSQCNRRIRNADGTEANYYWCNIMIDVVGSMLKAMDLK